MRTALLPKEHGAYGQMAFPLITALVVCGATAPALFTVVAIVTGFLAHEPALVLLGMRGARARRELARDARRWMLVLGAATCTAGALAVLTAPRDVLWSFAVPLLPAVLLAGAIAMRQEKSWHAEIAVALTFSMAALPLCLASGGGLRNALSVALPFASIFVAGTLAVRSVILRVRGGGDPRAAATTRAWTLVVVVGALVATASAAARDLLSAAATFAAWPGLALALIVALSTIPPTRLQAIGWTLVAASTIAAIAVIMGA